MKRTSKLVTSLAIVLMIVSSV